MPGAVKVRVRAARRLPVMDRAADTTDAFVEIRFGEQTCKTEVCPRTLNPTWHGEPFVFEADDQLLQDECVVLRVMDYDTYSANDSIGRVYIDVHTLLDCAVAQALARQPGSGQPDRPDNANVPVAGGLVTGVCTAEMSGWMPIYDTLHGERGELNVHIALELLPDVNYMRHNAVVFYASRQAPPNACVLGSWGLVSEWVSAGDPEFQWLDRIRTPRATNEARHALFRRLAAEAKRKLGRRCSTMGGNAVLGYTLGYDVLGAASGQLAVRVYGTCATLQYAQPPAPKEPRCDESVPVPRRARVRMGTWNPQESLDGDLPACILAALPDPTAAPNSAAQPNQIQWSKQTTMNSQVLSNNQSGSGAVAIVHTTTTNMAAVQFSRARSKSVSVTYDPPRVFEPPAASAFQFAPAANRKSSAKKVLRQVTVDNAAVRRASDLDALISISGGGQCALARGSLSAKGAAALRVDAPALNEQYLAQSYLLWCSVPLLSVDAVSPGDSWLATGGIVRASAVRLVSELLDADSHHGVNALVAGDPAALVGPLSEGGRHSVLSAPWWVDVRAELVAHAKALGCNTVVGYVESVATIDNVCIVSCMGTAILADRQTQPHDQNNPGHKDHGVQNNDCGDVSDLDAIIEHLSDSWPENLDRKSDIHCDRAHVPFQRANLPYPITLGQCAVCRADCAVGDVLLSTCSPDAFIDLLQPLPLTGTVTTSGTGSGSELGVPIQAAVSRKLQSQVEDSEQLANEISSLLPFVEHGAHAAFVSSLAQVGGANAALQVATVLHLDAAASKHAQPRLMATITGLAVRLTPLIGTGPTTVCTASADSHGYGSNKPSFTPVALTMNANKVSSARSRQASSSAGESLAPGARVLSRRGSWAAGSMLDVVKNRLSRADLASVVGVRQAAIPQVKK